MRILFNKQEMDFTLQSEETVGEVAAAISDWLTGSGFVISSLVVEPAPAQDVFTLPLKETVLISIETASVASFCVDALIETKLALEKLNTQGAAAADSAAAAAAAGAEWASGPAASFLKEREPELFNLINGAFNAGGGAGTLSGEALQTIIDERMREMQDPIKEFLSLEGEANSLKSRLEDFALDMQTGRDARAAETVRIFSSVSGKLLRLVPLLRAGGIEFEKLNLQGNFFEEFNQALKEFLAAYESDDTVMCGDIAEYELAPRLQDFYESVKKRAEHD
jgi:hypothetical protein